MKIRNILIVGVAAIMSAGSAVAAQVTFHGHDGYRRDNGGEFQARVYNGTGYAGETGKASDVGLNGSHTVNSNYKSFQTFCLELNENVDLEGNNPAVNRRVNTTISHAAEFGGANLESPDPISAQSAYLYTQFRNGTLAGYNYTNLDTSSNDSINTRRNTARGLQLAFWALEQELDQNPNQGGNQYELLSNPVNFTASFIKTNVIFNTTNSGFSTWQRNLAATFIDAAFASGWTNIGNVRVINYNRVDGNPGQSFLTLVPLPTAAWMGLGLLAAAAGTSYARRRALMA